MSVIENASPTQLLRWARAMTDLVDYRVFFHSRMADSIEARSGRRLTSARELIHSLSLIEGEMRFYLSMLQASPEDDDPNQVTPFGAIDLFRNIEELFEESDALHNRILGLLTRQKD